ncbi:MAG TPA: hypothetical protein VLT36_23370 [Candidatus Dormibacteraeota bacterium]|nr:hypothetical protein [Candidatus Dormibacteraeota bacterium]
MKPTRTAGAILDEGGVVITRSHLSVPGKRFGWGELGIVRLQRVPPKLLAWLFRILGQATTYHLMVGTKMKQMPVSVFVTRDGGLAARIEDAINQVAWTLGARRDV